MVARIANCMARHLITRSPELFIGYVGCNDVDEVIEHKEDILTFIYNAGLCHDFGKLTIIDTIYVYGRKLLDLEQDIIRSHAAMGAALLARHDSTKDYVDIAAGHHKWFDGSNGYSEDFDIVNSPCRTAIAIVCCADCMDTATDKIGRSYNSGIELEDYLKEVKEGAGTRYAPYMAELLENQEVIEDMKYLLSEGRLRVIRDTYRLLSRVHVDARI
jgi:HD-GYP domain-containing protein (c-di-GMP phosphodiesterase class II)